LTSFDEFLELSGLQPSFSRVGSGTKANPIKRIQLKRQTPLVSRHFSNKWWIVENSRRRVLILTLLRRSSR
jgi:hypothetical protein